MEIDEIHERRSPGKDIVSNQQWKLTSITFFNVAMRDKDLRKGSQVDSHSGHVKENDNVKTS